MSFAAATKVQNMVHLLSADAMALEALHVEFAADEARIMRSNPSADTDAANILASRRARYLSACEDRRVGIEWAVAEIEEALAEVRAAYVGPDNSFLESGVEPPPASVNHPPSSF